MERIWNYFFYSTWKFQILLGGILIEKPLIYLFNLIPFLKGKWSKGKKEYEKFMHNKDYGANIGFAFSFMFLTTTVIYTIICLFLVNLVNIEVGDKIYYYFYTVAALSYITNYFFLYRGDIYKKHFEEFEKSNQKSSIYLSALGFHLGVIGLGILSIHFTVGFNL